MKTAYSLVVALAALLVTGPLFGDDDESSRLNEKLDAVKKKLTTPTYDLRYKFTPGEQVRWKVVHLVTVETKIQGVTQTARTRSVSTKCWKVSRIDGPGNIVFDHVVENVDMWQKVTDRQEIRYNSETDKSPPPSYEHVAESVGVSLATVTIDSHGHVIKRDNAKPQFNPGIGELTVPLPDRPVQVGEEWAVPDEIAVRMPEGTVRRIKTRQLYTLVKVETGVATISLQTQVLTPVDEPKVKSQLVQRLTNGTIKFDVDAGRMLSKQMDLDETVIGFNGADSIMQYLARFTEEIQPAEVATAPKSEPPTQPAAATANTAERTPTKDRDAKPALRR
jgi:hypothetical protein